MLILTSRHRRIAVGGSSVYRGANLPFGITKSGLSLSSPFAGTTWDTSDLAIGSARYNASSTLTVTTSGTQGRTDLLAHLATHAASGADHRIVAPASVLTGGIYTLPAKTDPSKHCWIVASTINAGTFSTPVGTKIPTNQAGMATLEGPNGTVNAVLEFADSANARGYSLHGIRIQPNANNNVDLGIVSFRRMAAQSAFSGYPGRLFIDRCWLAGGSNGAIRRGVLANGPYFKIHDSRITDVHVVGFEAAGIGSWTGAQYHEHRRMTIEAATQSIFFGGADPDNANSGVLDSQDIFSEEIYSYKPFTWLPVHPTYAGTHWSVKTGPEGKNVRRWVINNSVTRNCWLDNQNGYAMLFQGLSDNNTNDLQSRVEDVVVRNHQFDYCLNGINLSSRVVYNGGTLPANPMRRMVFENIAMTRNGGIRGEATAYLKNGDTGTHGTALQIGGDVRNLLADRFTADGDKWLSLIGTGGEDWAITNHIARGGQYGIARSGGPNGLAGVQAACGTNLTYDGNVLYDYAQGAGNYASFGPGCDADETNSSMAFQDYANYDYRLTTQQLTKGVNGGVPGGDLTTLLAALAGVN